MDLPQGLTSAQASARLKEFGPNTIEKPPERAWRRAAKLVLTPMSLMFAAAAGLSLLSGSGADAVIIAALFVVNVGVGAWHDAKATHALAALRERLSVISTVMRDTEWRRVPAEELVPGDLIRLGGGDVIPADVTFIDPHNISANEAAVTGESLPAQKNAGDKSYAGAFITAGLSQARVEATGSRTYFGSALALAEGARRTSALEIDIRSVSRFLSGVSLCLIVVFTIALVWAHRPPLAIATLDVSMLIAGIPVALPTVMTLILSIGLVGLAKQGVLVRRLSSLEDLADVTLLLSDKTGTLTQNKISIAKAVPLGGAREDEMWSLAAAAVPETETYPLDAAVRAAALSRGAHAPEIADFTPGDSDRKHATAYLADGGVVALGAPQAVASLCDFSDATRAAFDAAVADATTSGYRLMALARGASKIEEHLSPVALFYIADPLRPDAAQTIGFLTESGIGVKMVTGDSYEISARVAQELGLEGRILRRSEYAQSDAAAAAQLSSVAGFAEVLPKDKYDIVALARKAPAHYIIAVTGDGVNDVPAVASADVGIAVQGAVDALKGAADLVLTAGGISVIQTAIIESRKIFVRLYNYSVYRISESFRLIVTIALIGIMTGSYPLTPVMIILIAVLNDIPIVSLALDRVDVPKAPTKIRPRERLFTSLLFGAAGILNSMLLFAGALYFFKLPWDVVQTMFFLKLTVSGHMLIYVAHTEKPWYSYLPSRAVILATSTTQIIATGLAVGGIFVTPIPLALALFVWVWSFFWMQISELAKRFARASIARYAR